MGEGEVTTTEMSCGCIYLTTATDALHLDVADAQARHTAPDAAEDETGELKAAQRRQRHRQHDRRAAVAPVLGLRVHLT